MLIRQSPGFANMFQNLATNVKDSSIHYWCRCLVQTSPQRQVS